MQKTYTLAEQSTVSYGRKCKSCAIYTLATHHHDAYATCLYRYQNWYNNIILTVFLRYNAVIYFMQWSIEIQMCRIICNVVRIIQNTLSALCYQHNV